MSWHVHAYYMRVLNDTWVWVSKIDEAVDSDKPHPDITVNAND